jgi:serine/threonine-protein kinase HipA
MDREALVYVDLDSVPHLMGRLWARTRKNKESATFEYDKTWLENPARFSLEPALQPRSETQTDEGIRTFTQA